MSGEALAPPGSCFSLSQCDCAQENGRHSLLGTAILALMPLLAHMNPHAIAVHVVCLES